MLAEMEDRRVADAMQWRWLHFAATGDPNVEGLPAWAMAGRSSRACRPASSMSWTVSSTRPTTDHDGRAVSGNGGVPTFAWQWDRVSAGCGVAAGYSHSSGGHLVRITGVKVDSAGNEWMRYTHDSIQTGSDPSDTQGLETVWTQLSDLDGDGILNMGAVSRELRVVWACCP